MTSLIIAAVTHPDGTGTITYPTRLKTRAKRALYDNLDQNEDLALRIDTAVRNTKKEGWIGNRFKEREVINAIRESLAGYDYSLDDVFNLVKNQDEYK